MYLLQIIRHDYEQISEGVKGIEEGKDQRRLELFHAFPVFPYVANGQHSACVEGEGGRKHWKSSDILCGQADGSLTL